MKRIPIFTVVLGLSSALAAAVAQTPQAIETVTIFGKGQTRPVQNITHDDLADALPGTNVLKTLRKLPGVSFQSADAFGAYEWSTRLSVRGFSRGQLGFTLDNIPLGNMSYGNNNGLHISRAIIPENIRRVDLAQGSGSVGTASTSNLGEPCNSYPAIQTISLAFGHRKRRAATQCGAASCGSPIIRCRRVSRSSSESAPPSSTCRIRWHCWRTGCA